VRLVYRALAVGGWLSHAVNQVQLLDNWDRSERVRPAGLLFWVGFGTLMAALEVNIAVSRPVVLALSILEVASIALIAALMVLGWAAGVVPFVRDKEWPEDPPGVGPASQWVGITGVVVDSRGVRRRFRNRRSRLELDEPGLKLAVRPFASAYSQRARAQQTGTEVELACASISRLDRGTAHLVKRVSPALRLTTHGEEVLLTFESVFARNLAAADIERSRHGLSSPRGATSGNKAPAAEASPQEEPIGGLAAFVDRTAGDPVWLRDVALAVAIGSAWRFLALPALGEPVASSGAIGLACGTVAVEEIAAGLRLVARPGRTLGALALKLVSAAAFSAAPAYLIGHGQAAAALYFVLSGLIVVEPLRRRWL
jgi:hypothetical protein